MSDLHNSARRFRVIPGREMGIAMQDVVALLRKQAANIEETATRCTDPEIVAELKFISEQLREAAKVCLKKIEFRPQFERLVCEWRDYG